MLSHTLFLVLIFFFSVLFSIVITSLGEERAGRASVCLSCLLYFSSSSRPLGVGGWPRLVILALPGHFI